MLDVKGLLVRSNRILSIGPVSFELQEGEALAPLGPNGSGKSTVLRVIAGLLPRSAGTVRLSNQHSPDNYRRRIGLVLDRTGFDPQLTGEENLHLLALLRGVPNPAAEVKRVAEVVVISHSLATCVKAYSLGMNRRLAIAAALLGNPRLLILDEPTNGLDPSGVPLLRQVLQQHLAAGGLLLLATHQLEEAASLCTHVVCLRNGGVVVQGSMAELLLPGVSLLEQYTQWQTASVHSAF